jgi:acyl dehydratase
VLPPRDPSGATQTNEATLTRTFEDFHAGETLEVGAVTVQQDEIIAFARQFDPQPMHIDPNAASFSIYGGLIASGWHTVSLLMRLIVTNLLVDSTSLGSPGVEELRWPLPVRPGDTLSGKMIVLETRTSNSRPTMGIVRWRGEMRNQQGQLVLSLLGTNFFGRRNGSAAS